MIDLLPIKRPSEFDPGEEFFYENIVKPMSKDFIKLMVTGITIDKKAVDELRIVLDDVLTTVKADLDKSDIITRFQDQKYPKLKAKYLEEMETKKKSLEHFVKPYKEGNVTHRTYAVNARLRALKKENFIQDKWTVKELKSLCDYVEDAQICDIIEKDTPAHLQLQAMIDLAEDKLAIYNKSHYTDKVNSKTREDLLPAFNPGSSLQLGELFEYLKIEPLSLTETGKAQWGRGQIEELQRTTQDEELKELLQVFIDFSFSAIVRNTFIEAFDKFTIGDTIHPNLKLFGAKSFRPTSNNFNALNMPSTGSIYAKPIKKCFIAPEGFITAAIDMAALEDRVIANLSGDDNKLAVFLEGLDGHSLAATYYFKEKVEKLIGPYSDHKEAAKKLKALVDSGDKDAKTIRQAGKPVSFGLSYGSFPKKVAATIKCSLEEATTIFNRYHDELFRGITAYRETVVRAQAQKQGYLHLGLGCRIYTDDVEANIRTLGNSTVQFWSILTLIAINELHRRIEAEGLTEDIKITSTIYDAIYFEVRNDAETIKWLNDNAVECMTAPYLEDEIVHNEAELDIGPNWADVITLKNNLSINEINTILKETL